MRPFALLMASVLAADWSAAVELQLGLLDSMTRHDAYLPLQQQHADSRQLLTVTIAAAGRERESTQVLLRSQVNTSVRVAVTRPAELPADALRVERLGFVWANNATSDPDQTRMFPIGCPSDELRKGGCWVPDPVLPLQNHGTVFLPAGLTVSLWLTFAAPAGVETLGRTYNASLTIADHTLALQLQVRHFALPLTPSLKTTVQLDVAHLHRCFPSEPEEATYRRYRQCVLHCRRSLSFSLSPPPSSPFSSLCACVRARSCRKDRMHAFTAAAFPGTHCLRCASCGSTLAQFTMPGSSPDSLAASGTIKVASTSPRRNFRSGCERKGSIRSPSRARL